MAAGVAEHSDVRTEPWRRLDGTLRSYLRIVFGTGTAARSEVMRLNELHRGISGTGYMARDPALALWVHATLVDSTLAVNDAWNGPLPGDVASAYYAETLWLGRAFGIPESMLPGDLASFREYVADQIGPDGPVRVGDTARELAQVVLHPPLPGVLARARLDPRLHGWTMWPAISLLPPRIREAYGLPWTVAHRAVATWLVTAWRTWNGLLPPTWREMPQARAADRRIVVGRRLATELRVATGRHSVAGGPIAVSTGTGTGT